MASLPGAHGIALALNERGVNEALESGVGEIASVVSATEEHSQANAHRSRDSAIANVKRLCEMRDASAHKPLVNAAISMALGCSITGAVDPKEVLRLVDKCLEAGVDFVAIADTVGYAGPKQVGELSRAAVKLAGAKPICIHLHDTRGMGIANAAAALDEGVRILDGSLGGLGGCPFAPGATGNVVFEDLVFLCESKGFVTGIDLDRLIAVRKILREEMPNEQLYGGLARAGLPGGSARRRREVFSLSPCGRGWREAPGEGTLREPNCQRPRGDSPSPQPSPHKGEREKHLLMPMPVLPHLGRLAFPRRDHHHTSITHATLRDDVVGEMLDLGSIALQRRHLHAIVVVEMDVQRCEREVVMAVEFLHQPL